MAPSPCPMLSPAEDMRGRIEADTSSSTLEEEFPPDLLEKTRGDKERHKHTLVLMWKMFSFLLNYKNMNFQGLKQIICRSAGEKY